MPLNENHNKHAKNIQFKKERVFGDHGGPIWFLKVTSDLLISGSSDKTIKVKKTQNKL